MKKQTKKAKTPTHIMLTIVAGIKIKFRWHGMPPGPSCDEPLGICIIFGMNADSDLRLTPDEIKEDIGIAFGSVVKKQLRLVFTRPAALADGTINLTSSFLVDKKVAHELGEKEIEVQKGIYKVDFSTFVNFGEVLLDIKTK
jgi:hypothetical protein